MKLGHAGGFALALLLMGCGDEATPAPVGSGSPAGGGGSAPASGSVATSGPSGSGGSGASGGGVSYPDPDWPQGDPADHGLDATKLDEAAAIAGELESHCLLVIRHGTVVAEHYWRGHDAVSPQTSWSVAKSYASALVGIAIARGELGSLDDPVADYVTEWQGTPKEAITVRHLLSMTSGLEWSLFDDYVAMSTFADDHSEHALGLSPAEPPESGWTYHNGAVQVLEPLFRAATGDTIEQYAEQHLWSAIGMKASWAHDPAGHPTAYASVLASCRDHARFGYLYLHGGVWSQGQVVPADHVGVSLSPSQSFNRAYGLLWWLNAETPALDPLMQPLEGRLSPIAPPDMFGARGFGNQFIDVVPSLDLMVVRFGSDPLGKFDVEELFADARFAKHDAILQAVLAAVVE